MHIRFGAILPNFFLLDVLKDLAVNSLSVSLSGKKCSALWDSDVVIKSHGSWAPLVQLFFSST